MISKYNPFSFLSSPFHGLSDEEKFKREYQLLDKIFEEDISRLKDIQKKEIQELEKEGQSEDYIDYVKLQHCYVNGSIRESYQSGIYKEILYLLTIIALIVAIFLFAVN